MRKLALALSLAIAPASAIAASLGVPLDQSLRITLPAPASDVIVGNPAIADVAVTDRRHLVITGKKAGVTNLVVADAHGRAIFDRQLLVSATSGGDQVAMIRGAQVVMFACAASCEVQGSDVLPALTPSQAPTNAPAAASPPGDITVHSTFSLPAPSPMVP